MHVRFILANTLALAFLSCAADVPLPEPHGESTQPLPIGCVPALATEATGTAPGTWCGVGQCRNLAPVCETPPPAWQCNHLTGTFTPCDDADCAFAPPIELTLPLHGCVDVPLANCALVDVTVTGELPVGVQLDDGRLTGRALLAGSWEITVSLSGAGLTAEQVVRLTVDGALQLSEVMVDPDAVTDAQGEWVEIYNPNPDPVDLSCFRLVRGVDGSTVETGFEAGARIPAHGTWIQARSAEGFQTAHGFQPDGVGLTGLVNSGDVLRLVGPASAGSHVHDCVAWGNKGDACGMTTAPALGSANGFERVPSGGCEPTRWVAMDEPGSPDCHAPFDIAGVDTETACFPVGCNGCGAGCRCRFAPKVTVCSPFEFFETGSPVPFEVCYDDGLSYRWHSDLGESDGAAYSPVFPLGGTFEVSVTASDGVLHDTDRRTIHVRTATERPVAFNLPTRTYGIDEALARFMLSASESVDAAFYDVDRPVVCEALAKLASIGVSVRLVVDGGAAPPDSCLNPILAAGGVVVPEPAGGRLMHHKFAIVDGERVWTGSYNPTDLGSFLNANNALVIDDLATVAAFEDEFEQLVVGIFGTNKTGSPLPVPSPHARTGVLFAPTHDVIGEIIARIEAATQSVTFLAFSFTHDGVAQAMVERHAAGLDVRGMIASFAINNTGSVAGQLAAGGVEVRKDTLSGFLHHKVIIIDAEDPDRAVLITGSFNFSESAQSQNDENAVFVFEPDTTMAYRDLFEILWSEHAVAADASSTPDQCLE